MRVLIIKRIIVLVLSLASIFSVVYPQNPATPQKPPQENEPDDVIRITAALVQTDVVVTDKNDHVVPDLTIGDFELYENGKKQDIKFMEYVGVDTGRRTEGNRPANMAPGPISEPGREVTARDLKRVFAFVIDDLTVPFQDLAYVRQALTDFVDNQMQEGDLVAIVRTVGGKGMLQQFTSDRQLLRRAISQLNVVTNPFQAYNNPAPDKLSPTRAGADAGGAALSPPDTDFGGSSESQVQDIGGVEDETSRLFRGLITLQTTNYLIDSMKQVPGQKSLVLISGGIPIFESSSTGTAYSSVSYILNQLTDNAVRSGVVINTLDPRGLRASAGVASFVDTPGKSALGSGGTDPAFGRGGTEALGLPLAGGIEHIGLNTLSSATGGVTIVNTNDLKNGLQKIVNRSRGYYLLAYTPADRFDNKFRKLQIKVKRDSLRVYSHSGYLAREEKETSTAAATKEQMALEAAKSPLARRDVDLAANVGYKLTATNKASVDINLVIEAKKLNFTLAADGKQQASFDVVGFVYDQYGKLRGGFSETINAKLSPEDYQRALKEGFTYTANTELPSGYFQFRAVVREADTGKIGTISRYLEIPSLSNGKLALSTLYLFAANEANKGEPPQPIQPLRQISRSQELRYAAVIYNIKRDSKARSQLIISQGGTVLFKEPEQPIEASDPTRVVKQGALGLSRVKPGRYLLTLIVTDPAADKKSNTISRSIDFMVVN
jgi:VWFA-related protein